MSYVARERDQEIEKTRNKLIILVQKDAPMKASRDTRKFVFFIVRLYVVTFKLQPIVIGHS